MNLKENKFKIGDRVAVYTPICRLEVKLNGVTGCYVHWVDVGGSPKSAHFKQCRRLIPKKKKPGDEIWVNLDQGIFLHGDMCGIDSEKLKDSPEPWIKYKRCK